MTDFSELLMPAGSLEKLKIAILYGADAVYMGTPDLSLRSRAAFSLDDVVAGVAFAQARGKRAYLTLNLFSHNKDIEKLPLYLETIRTVRPDGVIVADPGIFQYVRMHAPEIDLHISTQANVCSWLSVDFWKNMGAKLVVLAREVSFAELREIRAKCPDIRLEAFIHGAMCMTYSGRCLLSNFLVERGANQGNCANSCRWRYKLHVKANEAIKAIEINDQNRALVDFFLEEEQRPNEFLEIVEDARGSYLLNGKDLCLMPRLNEYLALGIDSLKIEGRNRSAYYVAIAARAYRRAIDAWRQNPEAWTPEPYMRELDTIANKGYSMAFHDGRLTHHAHNYEETSTLSPWEFAGIVREVTHDAFLVDVKNRILPNDLLEFVPPTDRPSLFVRLQVFEDVQNRRITTNEGIHAGQKPLLRIPFAAFADSPENGQSGDISAQIAFFPPLTVIRKQRSLTPAQHARLALDHAAQNAERGLGAEAVYQEKREALIAQTATPKAPPVSSPPAAHQAAGAEGCCGRGCNGCLHFWNDPAYEEARALLKTKPQGQRLSAEEAQKLKNKRQHP